jgi:deoxyribodipyrimidine photo-lyase
MKLRRLPSLRLVASSSFRMFHRLPLTRTEALACWQDFLPAVKNYSASRNHVAPGHRAVSQLSPALRMGLISPEEIVRDTLAQYDLRAAEKWVQEVCWRSYWKGWLEMRPQVWQSWRARLKQLRQTLPTEVLDRAEAVLQGRSGVAVMDHFSSELRETGYLHNHARMWWASFWVHVERLPWELGAEFFFQHLLDADPASNTLSWRWVAGLQTVGKTYLVRRSNLERYCAASLLKDTRGLERLEDSVVQPFVAAEHADLTRHALLNLPSSAPAAPGRVGLWLHPDDLLPEQGPLSQLKPVSVAAFTSDAVYAKMGLSPRRQASLHTALSDGVLRAAKHFGSTSTVTDAATTAAGVAAWVESEKLNSIVAVAPTVGPVADALAGIRDVMKERQVNLHLVRRPWDAELFPAARSGFFPFWEKTSRWLASQPFG